MPQLVPVPARKVGGRGRERERGHVRDLVLGELRQPAEHGHAPAAEHIAGHVLPEQVSRRPRVAGGDRVADRPLGVVVLGVPGARQPVQLALAAGLEPAQLRPQGPGEEPVDAVALIGAIERHDQQVRARELRKRLPGAGALQHGVAERPGELVEDRAAHEELSLRGGSVRQHLVAQVVGHEPVAAGEGRQRLLQVRLGAHGQRGEVQPDGPSLGQVHEPVQLALLQVNAGRVEQGGGLGARHREVRRRAAPGPCGGRGGGRSAARAPRATPGPAATRPEGPRAAP